MSVSGLKYLIKEGFKNLWINRMMSLASISVLICCLFLLGSAALVSLNVNNILKWAGEQNVVNVYIEDGVTDAEAVAMRQVFWYIPNIVDIEYVSREDALEIMKDQLGEDSIVLEGYDKEDNSLPRSYKIKIDDMESFDDTIARIKETPGIEKVQDVRDIALTLANVRNVVVNAGIGVIALLSVVSLFIIMNTIRLTLFGRRLEISIMKSVGATDWFVRLPFLVEGMGIGVLSGCIGFGILWYAYNQLSRFIADVLYMLNVSPIPFEMVAWQLFGCFVGAGLLVGVLGSMISIRRFSRREGGSIIG